jgi:Icc-related predicted phosphoesterase
MDIQLVLLADVHGQYRKIEIPDGDIAIFAGDLLLNGELPDVEDLNAYLGTLPHKHKIVIAGNHDYCMERDPGISRSLLTNGLYLQDQAVTLMGIKFYGSPWTPEFMNTAFNLPRGEALKQKWDLIPPDTEVLITHGPPYGFGDLTSSGEHAGDLELAKAVERIHPKLHVFGHIHEGYGAFQLGNTKLFNVCICDAIYRPVNKPILEILSANRDAIE